MEDPGTTRSPARHILVLTDRDWTHPQGGGTGTNLYGQISRWIAWGHRVTVVSGMYPGAEAVEHFGDRLTVHRMGTRLTVFPKAARAVRRGLAHDADVVVEVINGIAFFTPLWLRSKPRVALVHHVHRGMYVEELGRLGAVAAFFLETLPLRFLYTHTPFLTISEAAREDLMAVGVPRENVHVAYLGVEPSQFHSGERAPEPTLLYLGRLKQYKRVEHVLDVLEALPGAHLDLAGDGDWRSHLEEEIERRGLTGRVRMLGHVAEEQKADLYSRAWLHMTASSAEGWCLTVMEAAACGTPSAALRVGGLPESIVDGETGVLADTPQELAERTREVVEQPELRDRLGADAEIRARSFTWERTASANLRVLERAISDGHRSLTSVMRTSETAKAAGLAGAALVANAVQAVFTVIFAHVLGNADYGSLARLVTTFLILSVAGAALQVATAREVALGRLGDDPTKAATLSLWTRELMVALAGLAVAAALLRDPLASVIRVNVPWAAAATIPTGCLWLLLSIQRGALQGLRAYRPVGLSIVGEAVGRLVFGLALVGAFGVAGAFMGMPLAMATASAALAVVLHRRLGPGDRAEPHRRLRDLIGGAWAPVAALTLVFLLQNIDVIVIRYQVGKHAAGAYAAAAVAAKLTVWVAVGIAVYLLPEAARRAASGIDPRPVLYRAVVIVAAVGLPTLAIFAIAPHFVLQVAFGPGYVQASDALPILGAAMLLLAVAYLAVQYMLALGRVRFLWLLLVVAAVEPILLTNVSALVPFATVVLAAQCAAGLGMLVLSLRRPASPQPAPA